MLVKEVIIKLVDDYINVLLTMMHSKEEIKNSIYDLKKYGVHGPDDFGACVFQTYQEIIHKDVDTLEHVSFKLTLEHVTLDFFFFLMVGFSPTSVKTLSY